MVAQSLTAQTMIPMPTHGSVYTGSIRGYWFTAPVNMTIVGMRVPSDLGTGLQYIHLFRINDNPPVTYSVNSSNFTTLSYVQGATGGVIQNVNIDVVAGQRIGVLGGSTSSSNNTTSYASVSGPQTVTIGGQSATLTRLLYQGTIIGGPAPNYSQEPGGQIGRIELYYITCINPSITSQPQNLTKCTGDNATLTVAATSTNTYQWQVNTGSGFTNLSNGGNYSGVTSSTLSISSIPQSFTGYTYRCILTGTCPNNVTSSSATLTLADIAKVISQSAPDTICENNPITLGVLAMGPGLSYQWQISQGSNYANVLNIPPFSGSNTDTMTIAYAPDTLNNRRFRVLISTLSNCTTPPFNSNDILVGVDPMPAATPKSLSVNNGSNAVFNLFPANGILFQWQEDRRDGKGFKDISDNMIYSGTSTNKLTIMDVPMAFNNYKYRCMVSGICDGIAASKDAELLVGATSVNNISFNEGLSIYPNPTTGLVYFDAPEGSNVTLSSVEGKLIIKSALGVKKELDISDLANGIYIVQIADQDGKLLSTVKLSKE
jgi:hypothetical protein